MGHITRELDWAVIDIDTENGEIFVQSRWLYFWFTTYSPSMWTEQEKADFHNAADKQFGDYGVIR